jgi:DNA polymerase bacteriophage-type
MIRPQKHHDLIELTHGPVVPILSKALRAQFVAGEGKVFYGGDFSNIEGRINAWFANEKWKLDAFRAYDRGIGPDLYKLMASTCLGLSVGSITKIQRHNFGKYPELACGYQGSVGAWLRFDPTPTIVTRVVGERFVGTDAWKKAVEQYDHARHHQNLAPDSWIAIKVVINSWREANSRIVQSWWDLQDAAITAVDMPGTVVPVLGDKVAYMMSDGFLWCKLPSGKLLAYAKPHLKEVKEEWLVDEEGDTIAIADLDEEEIAAKVTAGAKIETGRTRTQVCFFGKNQKTGKWGNQYLYGGLQTNNVVQGTARELLRFAMHNVENAGYPIVLHVHDELVSEVDEGFGSVAEYQALMSILPPWLDGLPLAAKAWTDHRYVK